MACRAQPVVAAWTKNTLHDHFFKEAKKQGEGSKGHRGRLRLLQHWQQQQQRVLLERKETVMWQGSAAYVHMLAAAVRGAASKPAKHTPSTQQSGVSLVAVVQAEAASDCMAQ
jgi:hypothetical protein